MGRDGKKKIDEASSKGKMEKILKDRVEGGEVGKWKDKGGTAPEPNGARWSDTLLWGWSKTRDKMQMQEPHKTSNDCTCDSIIPVLTATRLVNGQWQNLTPTDSTPPQLTAKWLNPWDKALCHIWQKPIHGVFWENKKNKTKIIFIYTIFQKNPRGQTFRRIFMYGGSNNTK